MDNARNKIVCSRCGEVRLETPPGTTVLPTLGMARKAAGDAGKCDCEGGRAARREREKVAGAASRPQPPTHGPGEPDTTGV